MPRPDAEMTVVDQKDANVDMIFLPLIAIFAVVLFLGHRGAETTAGRITVDVLFGLLTLGCLTVWILMRRKPQRLEVTREAVTLTQPRATRSTQLLHAFGELRLGRTPGRYSRPVLRLDGTPAAIETQMFDVQDVIRACESQGWQFLD